MTPKDVFADIQTAVTTDVQKSKDDVDGTFRFNVSGDDGGTWIVDCKNDVGVRAAEEDADVTIDVTGEDLVAIADGTMDAMQAFMMGKVQVDGDMGLAMKLQQILPSGD